MKFVFNKNDLRTLARAEENCYLITNGLGGFSSLTIAGSCARGDQTLLMAALTAPNKRYQLIANTIEKLYIDGEEYLLSAQRFAKDEDEWQGFKYLNGFSRILFLVFFVKTLDKRNESCIIYLVAHSGIV